MDRNLAIIYGVATVAYIILIGVMMWHYSPWWFLGLLIWHWRWTKEWDEKHPDKE